MTRNAPRDGVRRIVITGANGFIGRHVAASLVLKGNQVVGVVRGSQQLSVPGVDTAYVSDILDADGIRSALHSATTVVHLAARVHSAPEGRHDPASECRRVNVDGTRLIMDQAAEAGVREFIFISSVKAVASESESLLTADTVPKPADAYGASKLEAEGIVRTLAARSGIHAPIIRLPLVYGPEIKANMLRLFSAVGRGVPLPFATVRNRRSFAHVANVVAAIEAVIGSPAAGQGTYYVSDATDLSTPQLVRHIAGALGVRPRLVPVPVAIMRGAGAVGGLLSRILPVHFTSDAIAALVGSLFVDTSLLSRQTGFRAPMTVEEGMAQTADWFKTHAKARD